MHFNDLLSLIPSAVEHGKYLLRRDLPNGRFDGFSHRRLILHIQWPNDLFFPILIRQLLEKSNYLVIVCRPENVSLVIVKSFSPKTYECFWGVACSLSSLSIQGGPEVNV